MFTPLPRLLIFIFLSVAAVLMAMQGNMLLLILASFLSLFLLWDYSVRKTVPLAYSRLLKEDYEGAEQAIAYTQSTQRLSNTNTAKYFIVKGMIAHHKDNFDEAYQHLSKALQFPTTNNSLHVMCLLTLTDICIIQKKNSEAKKFFNRLDGMNVPKKLAPTIHKLEDYLEKI